MLAQRLGDAISKFLAPDHRVDFLTPAGAQALCAADSISWQVFKNPVALFVGGVAAVILELAEPRVCSGVWEHSDFRSDPVGRMRRTGLAAMVTVYAARERAEKLIEGVARLHARVEGTTSGGVAYRALDPNLLDWVQATASFGFLEAYHTYVRALSDADKDRFYAEALPAAALYGAHGAPRNRAELELQFARMLPKLEASPVVDEFLLIVSAAPLLPAWLRPLQRVLVRAAIGLVPMQVRAVLGLDGEPRPLETRLVGLAAAAADRIVVLGAPPAQACIRLGLPANYLYVKRI